MSQERHFEVRLVRSRSRRPLKQLKMLDALGLRRIQQVVYLQDIPSVRGVLYRLAHVLEVTPVSGPVPEAN